MEDGQWRRLTEFHPQFSILHPRPFTLGAQAEMKSRTRGDSEREINPRPRHPKIVMRAINHVPTKIIGPTNVRR